SFLYSRCARLARLMGYEGVGTDHDGPGSQRGGRCFVPERPDRDRPGRRGAEGLSPPASQEEVTAANFAQPLVHEIEPAFSTARSIDNDRKRSHFRIAKRKGEIRNRLAGRQDRAPGRIGLRGLAVRRQAGAEGVRPATGQEGTTTSSD